MENNLYDNFFREYINLYPTLNDIIRVKEYRYLQKYYENSLSLKHINKVKELCNKYINIINKKKYKSYLDEIIKYFLNINLERLNYYFELIPLDHINNYFITFNEEISGNGYYIFESDRDYIDFINKMREFAEYANQAINNMKYGIKIGIVNSKLIINLVIQQLKSIIENDIDKNPNVPSNLELLWNKSIESFYFRSLKNTLEFLETEYIHKCRNNIGIYKDMYKFLIKEYTTYDINPEEIQELGLKEVNRIIEELKLRNYEDIIKNKNNYFNNENDILNSYHNMKFIIDDTIMKTHFYDYNSNYEIKSIPKYMTDYSIAYYKLSSKDKKRKGVFYINTNTQIEKFSVLALLLHEGLPGHNLTDSIISQKHNIYSLFTFNSYIEGWALYCEKFAYNSDNNQIVGKLLMELLRAIRLVVDVGIHYFDWSYDDALNYMINNNISNDVAIIELNRYIAIPGRALSYKIGELKINDIVNRFQDIKEGHDFILQNGPCPISLLENYIMNI